jgi:hypothetical protein
LALWFISVNITGLSAGGCINHTATGTRFLDPLVPLLSGSEDGVVRLLR